MGALNRLLLFVLSLAAATAGVCGAAFGFGFLPIKYIENELEFAAGVWETSVVSIIILLIALRLLFVSILPMHKGRKSDSEAVVVRTENGEVRVAKDAVRLLILEAVNTVRGVRDARVRLNIDNSSNGMTAVHSIIELSIKSDANAGEISDNVRACAAKSMHDLMSLDDAVFEVLVRDISSAPIERKHRVV